MQAKRYEYPEHVTEDRQAQRTITIWDKGQAHTMPLEESDAPIVPVRTGEIVVPELSDWQRLPDAPTSSQVVMRTSYVDKARGYVLVTLPLSLAGAGLAVLIVTVGFGVPVFSLAALLVAWTVFAGAWLAGWLAVVFVSGDGAALFTAWRAWRLVEREQSVRLQFYREKLRRLQEGDR